MLVDDFRFKRPLAVARDIERERAKIALERLGAVPVAGVGRVVGHRAALVVAEIHKTNYPLRLPPPLELNVLFRHT